VGVKPLIPAKAIEPLPSLEILERCSLQSHSRFISVMALGLDSLNLFDTTQREDSGDTASHRAASHRIASHQ